MQIAVIVDAVDDAAVVFLDYTDENITLLKEVTEEKLRGSHTTAKTQQQLRELCPKLYQFLQLPEVKVRINLGGKGRHFIDQTFHMLAYVACQCLSVADIERDWIINKEGQA